MDRPAARSKDSCGVPAPVQNFSKRSRPRSRTIDATICEPRMPNLEKRTRFEPRSAPLVREVVAVASRGVSAPDINPSSHFAASPPAQRREPGGRKARAFEGGGKNLNPEY